MHCIEVSDHLPYHTITISAFKVEFRALTERIRISLSIARVKTRAKRERNARPTLVSLSFTFGQLQCIHSQPGHYVTLWELGSMISPWQSVRFQNESIKIWYKLAFFSAFSLDNGQFVCLEEKNRENLLLFSICVTLEWENAEKLCEKLAKCHVRINENINKAINQARPNRIRKSYGK